MGTKGLKARTLIEMQELGLHVPDFFVLDSNHYHEFLKRDPRNPNPEFRAFISEKLSRVQGDRWIVRSSCFLERAPYLAFKDLFASSAPLNSLDEVINAIIALWTSACSQSASDLCERWQQSPVSLQVGLVVQTYIEADVVGSLWTLEPTTGEDKKMVVEASQEKSRQKILDTNNTLPRKPSLYRLPWFGAPTLLSAEENDEVFLNSDHLACLRATGHRLQSHFGCPQKIEFVLKNGELFFIQSTPLSEFQFAPTLGEWTSALFREDGISSAVVSPLSWSTYAQSFSKALPEYLEKLDLTSASEVSATNWLEVFYGRPYWNLGALKSILNKNGFVTPTLFEKDLAIGDMHSASESTNCPYPENHKPSWRKLWVSLKTLRLIYSQFKKQTQIAEGTLGDFPRTEAKYRSLQWHQLSKQDFALHLGQLFEDHFQLQAESFRIMLNLISGKYLFLRFFQIYKKAYSDVEALPLFSELGRCRSTLASKELKELALFLKSDNAILALEQLLAKNKVVTKNCLEDLPKDLSRSLIGFLNRYYYLSERELDLRMPRWSENARFVCQTLKTLMINARAEDLGAEENRANQIFEQAVARLEESHRRSWLRFFPGTLSWTLDRLNHLRQTMWVREELRDASMRMYFFIRQALLELSRRHQIPVDEHNMSHSLIFYSSPQDLLKLASGEFSSLQFKERAQPNFLYAHGFTNFAPPPELGGPATPLRTILGPHPSSAPTLQGIGASTGSIKSRARVITDISQANLLQPGEILVTQFTDPGWTPLFSLASGVVCESGGVLSHTGLVSREYGIPSVLNVNGATHLIRDGQEIEIDGSGGEVYLN